MFALRNAMQSDYNIGSFNFMRRFGEDLIKPHVQIHYQNVTGFQRHEKENRPWILAMKTVLEVDEDRQYVAKEDFIVTDVFISFIELLVGKLYYKAKKQKLATCKWVCQKCSRSPCKDHSNGVCDKWFQVM